MRKRRSRKRRFIKIFLPAIMPLVVCLSLLALPFEFSSRIKITLSRPIVPVQKAFLTAGNAVKKFVLWFPRSWDAYNRLRELEEEVFFLENMVVVQRASIDRLQTELASVVEYYNRGFLGRKPILANVVAYDTSDLRRSILIDVGSRHGVTKDSVVIADAALVGRVLSVGSSTSRVLLITDPASKVPARILETNDVGMVEGDSGNACRLKYLSRWGQKVEKGYKVVSSSMGGVFPDALFIASVVGDINEDGSPYRTLRLRPRVDISRIDTVLVLKK